VIDDGPGLASLVDEARRVGRVAVDTEMVWERTFYPALGVIQLGFARDGCHLLDAVALDGQLRLLGQLLADDTVKILHDAVQDLTILRQATGLSPRNVFDTRVAAGFVGLACTVSLRDLLADLVGVELEKTETRTDWLQRPLADTQVGYAEDDVRYLVDAYEELVRRARERNVWDWMQEEMRGLDEASLYEERDPREEFRRVKGYGKLRREELAVLRELAAWREQVARAIDRPRGRVASDKLLLFLSQRQPTRMEDLGEVRSLRRRDVEDHGEALVRAVNAGLQLDPAAWPNGPPRLHHDRALEMRCRAASARVKERAQARDIDPGLVATRADVRGLVREGPEKEAGSNRLAGGWRWTLVGEEVAAEFHEP
jgi:ribonuclease D